MASIRADSRVLVQVLLDWNLARRNKQLPDLARRAKLAVVCTLWDSEILLAVTSEGPAVGRSPSGQRVVWGFSDSEAFSAWRALHEDGGTGPPDARPIGGNRSRLGAVLRRGEIDDLVLNPAGPAVAVVGVTDEYLAASRPLLYHPRRPGVDPRLDAEGREGERSEHARLLDEARRPLEAGDVGWFDDHSGWADPIIGFGDLLRYGLAYEIIVDATLYRTEAAAAVARARYPLAQRWGAIGESVRAARQLIAAGATLAAAIEASSLSPADDDVARRLLGVVIGEVAALEVAAFASQAEQLAAVAVRYPAKAQ